MTSVSRQGKVAKSEFERFLMTEIAALLTKAYGRLDWRLGSGESSR